MLTISLSKPAYIINFKEKYMTENNILNKIKEFIWDNINQKFTIPKGITSIADYQFTDTINLKAIEIPEGVTSIGFKAFANCINLTTVELPKSIRYIAKNAFENCSQLSSIVIPEGITTIEEDTFRNCYSLSNISLPSTLTAIKKHSFDGCENLTNITLPDNLLSISSYAFYESGLEKIVIPHKVSNIPAYAFYDCFNLREVVLPDGLKTIGNKAFHLTPLESISLPYGLEQIDSSAFSTTKIQQLELPSSIKVIENSAFSLSKNLKKITLPEGLQEIAPSLLKSSILLKEVHLPSTIQVISESAFSNCYDLSEINFPRNLTTIKHNAFHSCKNLTSVDLPRSVKSIGDNAFSFTGLEKISLYPLEECGSNIFSTVDFRYIHRNPINGQLYLTKDILSTPANSSKLELYPLTNFNNHITNFDCSKLIIKGNIDRYNRILNHLVKSKAIISANYLKKLETANMIDEIGKTINFSYLMSEMPNFQEVFPIYHKEEQLDILKFATVLGCFSNQKIKDKNGNDTDTIIGQKASSFFANIFQRYEYISFFHDYFDSLNISTPVSQSFLDFITQRDNKGYYNLFMLLRLEDEYPNIFVNCMHHWQQIEEYRNTLDNNGLPTTLSWEKAITKFHTHKKYENVSPENQDIASILGSKGISQEFFEETISLRNKAKLRNIRHHILDKHLKEDSLLNNIERTKNSTEQLLSNSKQQLDSAYSKKFTFEMLDKYDPRNAIMGIYCSCCGTITSTLYGKNIATATMLNNNVQNLVIKNHLDEIIAKGTIYINPQKGYAVINDIEINRRYRNHETDPGRYSVTRSHKEEIEREEIFETFMSGIRAFVKEYDIEHPNIPIKQVNIGWGYNRLKSQCERFKYATHNLSVPIEFSFIDARDQQRILYKRQEKSMEK